MESDLCSGIPYGPAYAVRRRQDYAIVTDSDKRAIAIGHSVESDLCFRITWTPAYAVRRSQDYAIITDSHEYSVAKGHAVRVARSVAGCVIRGPDCCIRGCQSDEIPRRYKNIISAGCAPEISVNTEPHIA